MNWSDNTATGSVTRESDGQISLTFRTRTGVVKYTAPPNIWASHFCNASEGGEEHFRWYTAMSFLKSSGAIDVIQVPPEREGLNGHGSGEPPKSNSQPCGHPAACVSTGDEGTPCCLACAAIAGHGPWAMKVPKGHVMLDDGRVVKYSGELVMTGDDCLIFPHAFVWVNPPHCANPSGFGFLVTEVHRLGPNLRESEPTWSECFSTREAAEAARERGKA